MILLFFTYIVSFQINYLYLPAKSSVSRAELFIYNGLTGKIQLVLKVLLKFQINKYLAMVNRTERFANH